MELRREWAMPSHETFLIKPFAKLIPNYVKHGQLWADPFAGDNSPAKFTNDLNPNKKATHHLEADEFMKTFEDESLDGVLLDPPYSPRQITECYKGVGRKATMLDTSNLFFSKIKKTIAKKIKHHGVCITWGWNSNAMGASRGFEKELILLVAHGGNHNDTICVVERKTQLKLSDSPIPPAPKGAGILG